MSTSAVSNVGEERKEDITAAVIRERVDAAVKLLEEEVVEPLVQRILSTIDTEITVQSQGDRLRNTDACYPPSWTYTKEPATWPDVVYALLVKKLKARGFVVDREGARFFSPLNERYPCLNISLAPEKKKSAVIPQPEVKIEQPSSLPSAAEATLFPRLQQRFSKIISDYAQTRDQSAKNFFDKAIAQVEASMTRMEENFVAGRGTLDGLTKVDFVKGETTVRFKICWEAALTGRMRELVVAHAQLAFDEVQLIPAGSTLINSTGFSIPLAWAF